MEQALCKDVLEKLLISMKEIYCIPIYSFENNPLLASQLAYVQMIDHIFTYKEDLSVFCLYTSS